MPARAPATGLPGASHLHRAGSFAMMLGGQLDIGMLGGVPGGGWSDPGGRVADPGSRSTLVPECTYPLTGVRCVSWGSQRPRRVRHRGRQVQLREAFGVTFEELPELVAVPIRARSTTSMRRFTP